MKTFLLFTSFAATALLFAECGQKSESAQEVPFVDIVEVVNSNITSPQSFTGKTKPASEVNLSFRVSGQITRMLVNEGDHVKVGQVVAEMDDRDYRVQLLATEAEYSHVKADAERVMSLYEEGNTTASNYDKARYGLEQISQKLANHTNQLNDTKLRSTIDGYVQTKYHESGETVSAGMPVLGVFSKGHTEVEIKVSAADFAQIAQFTDFYSKFDVTGDVQHPMQIVRTSQEANSSQLYSVRLRFSDGSDTQKITPGMTAMVYASKTVGEGTSLLSVPTSAVFNTNGKAQVYVYDEKSGVVQLRDVKVTALHRNGTCELISGVKAGEKIVSSGVHHVSNGQQVKPLQKPSESNVGGLL